MTIFKLVIIAIFCACMFGAGYYCGAAEKDGPLTILFEDEEDDFWEDEDD